MAYERPAFKEKYDNFIGGEWTAPVDGKYFENFSPIDDKPIAHVAQSNRKDIDLAVAAGWEAFATWGKTSAAERSAVLNKIADIMEANLEALAVAETWDNGKPIRETLNADIPLAIDHFRYFASVIRAESGAVTDLDANTVSMEIHEPLGVVGQIIPWNFPLLMMAWKVAPAIAAGNAVVLKPAEQTPVSVMVWMDMVKDVIPAGVVNTLSMDLDRKRVNRWQHIRISKRSDLPERRQRGV